MNFRRLLAILIGFIILASIIFGVVMFVRSRFSNNQTPVVSTTTQPTASAEVGQPEVTSPTGAPVVNGSRKVFQSGSVAFRYPSSWSVLSCTNSLNFEFNPAGGGDQRGQCDVARLPITVLVNTSQGCGGQSVNLGGISVMKSQIQNARGTDYQWCFSAGGQQYSITHRVSQSGSRATSKDDFSAQIEQIIQALNQPGGGS